VLPVVQGQAEAEKNIIKLTKSVEWEGTRIDELNLNLEALTGLDIEAAEREWVLGGGSGMPETSKGFLIAVAARATGVRTDVLRRLSSKDYTKITVLVQNFLLV